MRFLLVTVCLGLMAVTARAEERLDAAPATPSAAPTAAALSEPGALAAYVTESLKATGRCVLPVGVIKTDVPIVLERLHGGVVEGSGPPYAGAESKSGWRSHPDTVQASTQIVMTDPVQPAITMKATINVELRNFGVETSGVGLAFKPSPGWGNSFLHLHRVAFRGCEIAFKAGEEKTDPNAADVSFSSCQFYSCKTGLEVNHLQGVNYLFDGLCFFGHVERAVVFNEGGFSHLENCTGFDVGTWLTINGGGPNLMPCRITHLYSDRTKDDPPPVIVDATGATNQARVVVDGVKVTQQGLHDRLHYSGHVYYRLPKDYKRWKSAIRVRDNDLNNYPWGGVYEPQMVD
jgi:hypothetical protein